MGANPRYILHGQEGPLSGKTFFVVDVPRGNNVGVNVIAIAVEVDLALRYGTATTEAVMIPQIQRIVRPPGTIYFEANPTRIPTGFCDGTTIPKLTCESVNKARFMPGSNSGFVVTLPNQG